MKSQAQLYCEARATLHEHHVRMASAVMRKSAADLVLALKWQHMADRDRTVVRHLAQLEHQIRALAL